ncbi:MAG TPA: tRNA pseudouridine(13) synthase TruD, partial [Candidatus Baltobacteraceae bacterium]|nr:tRNA pseudouridine(13) synthase TruD [Candidatus Baltobacteraceae bacterium]
MDLPYLTTALPPIPLRFKVSPADFIVEEIPRFDPCGSGDHVYVLIEKVGRTTRQAVNALARALSVPAEHIGVAGQKDAEGLTRQYLSVLGAEPARIQTLALPQITILGVARHRAKLRLGDLKGNRFQLRLRGVDAARLPDLAAVLDVLTRRGVPNYFGPQRFGMR